MARWTVRSLRTLATSHRAPSDARFKAAASPQAADSDNRTAPRRSYARRTIRKFLLRSVADSALLTDHDLPSFLYKWSGSGEPERANTRTILDGLADVFDVARPDPTTNGAPSPRLPRGSAELPYPCGAARRP